MTELTPEQHKSLNHTLGLIVLLVKGMNEELLDKAIKDYEYAIGGSTAFMTIVDRPFQWLDNASAKLKLLKGIRELKRIGPL